MIIYLTLKKKQLNILTVFEMNINMYKISKFRPGQKVWIITHNGDKFIKQEAYVHFHVKHCEGYMILKDINNNPILALSRIYTKLIDVVRAIKELTKT